jgi:hypothetical protein
VRLKLNEISYLLVYVNDMNLLLDDIDSTGSLIDASKEVGL